MNKKAFSKAVLTAALMGLTAFPTYAATKVTGVNFTISESKEDAGTVSSVDLTENNAAYDIEDYSWSTSEDSWTPGQKVTGSVTITANDGYYFSKSDTKVSIHGGKTANVTKTVTNSKITVKFNYNPHYILPEPTNIYFDDENQFLAKWDKVQYAKYEVQVQVIEEGDEEDKWKNLGKVLTATSNKIDLSQHITDTDVFRFKIRSVAKNDKNSSNIVASDWVYSDELVSEMDNTASGSFSSSSSGITFKSSETNSYAVGWQYINGYWYNFDSESHLAVKDAWLEANGNWYRFDNTGKMITGWTQSNGRWYYLNPTEGNFNLPEGAMVKGWAEIKPGVWSYLNPVDGQDGMPIGALYVSTTTPDGYAVDANGEYRQAQ